MRIVALDTETTGFNTYRDRIVELALVELNPALEPIGQWVRRFNPGIPIPPRATAHHGIRDQDVAGLPPFRAHAARVQSCLAGATLVAYNGTRFDIPLIDCELRRANQPGLRGVRIVDPLLEFRRQVPHTLTGALQYYCQKRHERPHAALSDVEAMLDVLRAQVRQGPVEVWLGAA